ncbi:hypothetical protein HBI81_082450 [Parastagonospora nodorum]|nr:hypothetical protein HBI09_108570 [Parastagonospora nodorum]KAH4110649.1 hypothetical protein HBH46_016050 [Parastagonospora nodorum]KAH4236596.1 hypothetical protein HBI06_050790 [Parastagonospora nodorum]KAH4248558.1 hypothetical protein HBI05_021130 [Parastagonospora nodorum]KAH4260884.1 hypothetical protein HBI03_120800 [Parastagonospora nodorum]
MQAMWPNWQKTIKTSYDVLNREPPPKSQLIARKVRLADVARTGYPIGDDRGSVSNTALAYGQLDHSSNESG